jgi:hypothetical protein
MVNIEVMNVMDLMATGFDNDGVNEMALGSNEVSRLVAGSIFRPSTLTPSKSIATPSTSNLELEVT